MIMKSGAQGTLKHETARLQKTSAAADWSYPAHEMTVKIGKGILPMLGCFNKRHIRASRSNFCRSKRQKREEGNISILFVWKRGRQLQAMKDKIRCRVKSLHRNARVADSNALSGASCKPKTLADCSNRHPWLEANRLANDVISSTR